MQIICQATSLVQEALMARGVTSRKCCINMKQHELLPGQDQLGKAQEQLNKAHAKPNMMSTLRNYPTGTPRPPVQLAHNTTSISLH